MATLRSATILLLTGCSLLGAYTTLYTASNNGLLPAIDRACGPEVPVADRAFPGGPTPYKTTFTGVDALDGPLMVLIAFFSYLLGVEGPEEERWVVRSLMGQFAAGWVLVTMEGLRRGNQGRAVSWTGTVGFVFQNLTYTVTIPIYFIAHLLTSPLSNSPGLATPSAHDLTIDTADATAFPLALVVAFVIPSILMTNPDLSADAHYTWLAVWQVFPVVQSIVHGVTKPVLRALGVGGSGKGKGKVGVSRGLYLLAVALTVVPQVMVLVTVGPRGLMPSLAGLVQAGGDGVEEELTVGTLAGLVKVFLEWDVFVGGVAGLLWAWYVTRGWWLKVVGYVLVGGPSGAMAMLLWERDEAAVKGETKKEE